MIRINGINFLDVEETGIVLHKCAQTIRNYVNTGKLPSLRLGKVLIKEDDICQLLGCERLDLSQFKEEKV